MRQKNKRKNSLQMLVGALMITFMVNFYMDRLSEILLIVALKFKSMMVGKKFIVIFQQLQNLFRPTKNLKRNTKETMFIFCKVVHYVIQAQPREKQQIKYKKLNATKRKANTKKSLKTTLGARITTYILVSYLDQE